jgi:hypothetical protein
MWWSTTQCRTAPTAACMKGSRRWASSGEIWVGSWERLSWEAEDVVEVSPHYVVLVNHITGRGACRGIEVDARGGHVWEVVAERCGA